MNSLLSGLINETNVTHTENGAIAHKTTTSAVLDLFAMGAASRSRSDEDVIFMFKKAFAEDEALAMKCLFYIRDIRGGQGERRFFRVVMRWLAQEHPDAVLRNLKLIPEYGRWDDLYCLEGTSCESAMFNLVSDQFALDLQCKTPSLLGKWLKSENASSNETKRLAAKTRKALGLDARTYRHGLTILRSRIKIVETLMSQNRWDEIEFDKLPSRAGFVYRNAFAHNDVTKARYEAFMASKTTKVHANALYPYEVVDKACEIMHVGRYKYTYGFNSPALHMGSVERNTVNKYWDSFKDWFDGQTLNALCMIDTSGSMTNYDGIPINAAVSLGMYCAERAKGPFAGHYISFSSRPQLVSIDGVDFCDRVSRIVSTNLCENTNIEAAFDMLLNIMTRNRLPQSDLPEHIIVISDMEFDEATRSASRYMTSSVTKPVETLMDGIERRFSAAGYEMPKLVYWNVRSSHNNIPQLGSRVSYVSGFSPSIFETILSGKTGYELMLEKLNSERYKAVR